MPERLGAIGIGVADMARSVAFYKDQLGMVPRQFFDINWDIASFTETVMTFPRNKGAGPPILLMEYKNTPPPKNQLGKLVFHIEDVKAMRDKLVEYGCEIFLELGEGEGWSSNIFMCRDPDGFVLEFVPLSLLDVVRKSNGKL